MEIFYVGGFIRDIVILLIGVGLTILGIWIGLHLDFDLIGSIMIAVGLIIATLFTIGLCIETVILVDQRNNEPVIYQEMVAEGRSLEQALSNSYDIVNTDLYTRAVDWNTKLAKIQAAAENPKYAISFTGKVDWSSVEPIDFSYNLGF